MKKTNHESSSSKTDEEVEAKDASITTPTPGMCAPISHITTKTKNFPQKKKKKKKSES
jgi:hypothetical protein